jgi:hypothetical protein
LVACAVNLSNSSDSIPNNPTAPVKPATEPATTLIAPSAVSSFLSNVNPSTVD